jgi:hypothetical protein
MLLTEFAFSSPVHGVDPIGIASQQEETVSDDEASQFAEQWGAALVSADRAKVHELIAFEEIVLRAMSSAEIPEKYRRGAAGGARDGLRDGFNPMYEFIGNGGSYDLVSIRMVDGDPFVLFRMTLGESGFNFHKFRLRRIRGKVRADQCHNGLTGEKLGDTVSQNFRRQTKMYSKTKKEKDEYLEQMNLLQKFGAEARAGDKSKAMKLYRQLPKDIQQEKIAQLYRVMAHQDGEAAKYAEVLEDVIKSFPGDPALAMILFDSAAVKGDMKLLMKAHDMLNKWTGGDPYIDLLAGVHLAENGELDKAIKLTQGIDPATTNVYFAHTFKISIALVEDDFDCVLRQLRYIRDNYKTEFNDLQTVEGYEKFVKSPQFKEWSDETKQEKSADFKSDD